MNTLIAWLYQLGSPALFDRFAFLCSPICCLASLPMLTVSIWQLLLDVPADYQQGDSFRTIFVHVRGAWMGLFVLGLMAVRAAIELIGHIKACEMLAMAYAPFGTGFTIIALLTGNLTGRATRGTWRDRDPRLTTELALQFLHRGDLGLCIAVGDRRNTVPGAPILTVVGAGLLPGITYSAVWWRSLQQRITIKRTAASKLDTCMQLPLCPTMIVTKFWICSPTLTKVRAEPAARCQQIFGEKKTPERALMTHLRYVLCAYVVFALVLCADVLGSWLRLRHARATARGTMERRQRREHACDRHRPAKELSR